MKILFKAFLLLTLIVIITTNTKDPEFVEKFKPKYITKGFGSLPNKNSIVKLHYTTYLLPGDKKIDSSYDRRKLYKFQLNRDQAIPCWEEVIPKMQIGEKIYVICPSDLAYGKDGIQKVVPPNSDLGFEIDIYDYENESGDL